LGLWLLAFIFFLVLTADVHAVESDMPPVAMPAGVPSAAAGSVQTVPLSSPKMPSAPSPIVASAAQTAGAMEIPNPPPAFSGTRNETKTTDSGDIKVPDSVKAVVKHLGTATDNITLDDLNAAREAIARLDVLIDIEKRLADLDKIREEREKKSMAAAIPASALAMPTPSHSFEAPPPSSRPRSSSLNITDVVYIEGSNGHYAALVKEEAGTLLVHAGEHLQDGTVILAITPEGVELENGNTKRLLQVKSVQALFRN